MRASLIATHYRSAYTTKVVTNSVNVHSAKSNCEADGSTSLLSNVHGLFLKDNKEESETDETKNDTIDPIILDPDFSEENLSSISFVDEEAISYISRNVCSKLVQTFKCEHCTEIMETDSEETAKRPTHF